MSDQPGWPQPTPEGWQQPTPGQFPPAEPYPYSGYPPQPYPQTQYGLAGGPVPPRPARRKWWIWGVIGVIIAVVAGGVTWAFTRGNDTGAESPTAAVQGFLSALERNDVLAAADLLEPTERAGVRSVLENASKTASHTGYQRGGGGNGLFDGVKFTADDVQTDVTEVGDDLARVTMTGGKIGFLFNPARANEGLRELLADKDETENTWNTRKLTAETDDGDKVPPAAMAVKRSGKWYVSLLYTYFDETARIAGKRADPQQVKTKSFSSPQEAAKGFVDGIMEMFRNADVAKLAESLSPNEGALLSTYRQLFKMRHAMDDLQVTSKPKYEVKTNGDFTTVSISDLTFEYTPSGRGSSSREINFPDCDRSNASWCYRGTRLPHLVRLPGLAEVNRHGFVAMKDDTGWHINLFASYFNVAADYLGHATKEEVALLVSRVADSPRAFTRLDGQTSVKPGNTISVDLKALPNTARQYMSVVDLPVRSGERYTLSVSGANGVDWYVVGKSGELEHGDVYQYSSGDRPTSFTAVDDETAKLVLLSRSQTSVSVTLAD